MQVATLSSSSSSSMYHPVQMFCYCGYPAKESTAHPASNYGRRFLGCFVYGVEDKHCSFFSWKDESFDPRAKRVLNKVVKENEVSEYKMRKLHDSNRRLKLERKSLSL